MQIIFHLKILLCCTLGKMRRIIVSGVLLRPEYPNMMLMMCYTYSGMLLGLLNNILHIVIERNEMSK